jgi:hypothetical protein
MSVEYYPILFGKGARPDILKIRHQHVTMPLKVENTCVRATKIKEVPEDKLEHNADAAAAVGNDERVREVKEVKVEVTPEMVEAGKLAIDELPKNNETKSLENSIEEVYVAMATKDKDVLRDKENVATLTIGKRNNFLLYCGGGIMFILGCVLITLMVVSLLS